MSRANALEHIESAAELLRGIQDLPPAGRPYLDAIADVRTLLAKADLELSSSADLGRDG